MTSSNGNIFRVTGHLCGKFTGPRSPVNLPHKGQWRGALMFSLIYAWMNDWVNNREAGDLRRQHGHYDVIVMCRNDCILKQNSPRCNFNCLDTNNHSWSAMYLFLSITRTRIIRHNLQHPRDKYFSFHMLLLNWQNLVPLCLSVVDNE